MADENKRGFRQRKSTNRRSSILKQHQDTCFFPEDTVGLDNVQTPTLKRRVSFASTTTVRTFEKQPLHLSDDSISSGITHNDNDPETLSQDDVFLPRSFLLAGVNKSQQSNAPDSSSRKVPTESNQRPRECDGSEQNKTILYCELSDDDCAMEITANVSQLSSSWFRNENSFLENNENIYQYKSDAMENVRPENIQPRSVPWSEGGDHEVEKTRIFLASDDDHLEITSNINMPPFISERYEDPIYRQQRHPIEINLPLQGGDDNDDDMEMTGVIGELPKRRSVLVDLTENKALTPIQEMSVSSSLSMSDQENRLQHKSFSLSRVCEKLHNFESSQKYHSNIENEPLKDVDDDPEVSFNFHGPSPRNAQVIQRKTIGDEIAGNSMLSRAEGMSRVSIKNTTGGSMICQETTTFSRSMEITPRVEEQCAMSKSEIKPALAEHTVYMNDMEMTECISSGLIHSNDDVWQANNQDVPSQQQQQQPVKEKTMDIAAHSTNTIFMGDMEVTGCVSSIHNASHQDQNIAFDYKMDLASSGGHNLSVEKKKESVENTLYLGDMELTSFAVTNKFKVSEDKTCYEKTMDMSVSRASNNSGRERKSEFPQSAGSKNTSLSYDTSMSDKFYEKEKSIEHTVFLTEMELTEPNTPFDFDHTKSNSISEGGTKDVTLNHLKPERTRSFDLQEAIGTSPMSFCHNALGPQELDDKQSACFDDSDQMELHDSISLSEIAGLKTPKKDVEKKSKVCSFLEGNEDSDNNYTKAITQEINKRSFEDCSKQKLSVSAVEGNYEASENILMAKQNNQTEPILAPDNCKSDSEKGKFVQDSLLPSDHDGKRAALRKSLCNELMFPYSSSERNYTKGLFQSRKSHTTEVKMNVQTVSRTESPVNQKENIPVNSQSQQLCDNLPSERPESADFDLASNFSEEEDEIMDEACPALEDLCDSIPLNESFKADQEELAFSYMCSIMENPGGQTNEAKDDEQEESDQENVEFSDICHVMGIEEIAVNKQEMCAKTLSTDSVADRLNVNLFVKPEIATLENYVKQLQEETSRNQQIVEEKVKKFSHCPSKTYINTRNAQKQGLDVSSTKLKVQEMARACTSSAHGKLNRRKTDYLMQLTSAQQTEYAQQKRDLDQILSDIEKIANVSAEIDKCLEDLNTFDHTRSEIKQLKKKTEDVESETCKLRLHCDCMEKQILECNESAKNTKHRLKEEEEEQKLFLDKISFMACLSEWSLLTESKNNLRFGFLFNTVIVNIGLLDGRAPHQRISDISFKPRLSSKCCPWARVAHTLMLSSLDRDALMNRYEDFSQLNMLLAHLSELAGVSRELCSELKSLHLKHKLTVEGLKVTIRLLHHEQNVEIKTTFKPGLYPVEPLSWEANILMSPLTPSSVVDVLNQVDPGVSYITRSLDAVLGLMSR